MYVLSQEYNSFFPVLPLDDIDERLVLSFLFIEFPILNLLLSHFCYIIFFTLLGDWSCFSSCGIINVKWNLWDLCTFIKTLNQNDVEGGF